MTDVPPLLVARLPDTNSVTAFADAALTGGVVHLELDEPPATDEAHVVVVHSPVSAEPFVLTAIPEGQAGSKTTPLRIQAIDATQTSRLRALASVRAVPSTLPPPTARPSPYPERTLTDARADPLLGRALCGGKFVVEAPLGAGGFAAVYRGTERPLGRLVAIKILQGMFERHAELAMRFEQEAVALSHLDHPNVLRVLDYGEEDDGLLYIVTELLSGKTLGDLLEHEGPQRSARVADIGAQVCAGLAAAHDKGIIHRDVKADNVILESRKMEDGAVRDHAKLFDFGIAKIQPGASAATQRFGGIKTGADFVCGTPEYMSPEQVRGNAIDARSDVYAVAILLYVLVTGTVPFTGPTIPAVLLAQLTTPPTPPTQRAPGMDPRLEKIILKAMAKDPAHRYQTARELGAELRAISPSV